MLIPAAASVLICLEVLQSRLKAYIVAKQLKNLLTLNNRCKKTFQIKVLPLLIRIICPNFAGILNDYINQILTNGPF